MATTLDDLGLPVFFTSYCGPAPDHEQLADIITTDGILVTRCTAAALDQLCRRWLEHRSEFAHPVDHVDG